MIDSEGRGSEKAEQAAHTLNIHTHKHTHKHTHTHLSLLTVGLPVLVAPGRNTNTEQQYSTG